MYARTVVDGSADESLFWAWETVTDLVQNDLEAGWHVVLELVRAAKDDRMLAYIAAGPLEDLLCSHGSAVIERVEQQAAQDRHFRRGLSGVWGWNRMPHEIWARIEAAVGTEPRL